MSALDETSVGAAALASLSLGTTMLHHLMLKGLVTREDVSAIFEATLNGLEQLGMPDDPAVRLAHALVDEQARLILGSDRPKPEVPEDR